MTFFLMYKWANPNPDVLPAFGRTWLCVVLLSVSAFAVVIYVLHRRDLTYNRIIYFNLWGRLLRLETKGLSILFNFAFYESPLGARSLMRHLCNANCAGKRRPCTWWNSHAFCSHLVIVMLRPAAHTSRLTGSPATLCRGGSASAAFYVASRV